MKFITLLFLGFCAVLASCTAQTATAPAPKSEAAPLASLENRVFSIDSYVGDKKENSEDLTFKNGQLSGSECVKYGFEPGAFVTTTMADGSTHFQCTMVSPKEGKMTWDGKVLGNVLDGKVIWSKTGQADALISYIGKEK
jgi:hypothetical protein